MAIRRPEVKIPILDLAAALLAQPEAVARAQVIAVHIAEVFPGSAVVIYVLAEQPNPVWNAKAVAGDITVTSVIDLHEGTLGRLAESKNLLVFEGSDLKREDYSHLDIRRTFASLAYLPLLLGEVLIGAVEILSFEDTITEETLNGCQDVADLAALALSSSLTYESERNASLQAVSRITQMYDLEKVFNSTLEMDELLGIIAKKFYELMNVQGINLWMVNGEVVQLMSQAGLDATLQLGMTQAPGEGIAGDLSENGELVLIEDSDDGRLKKRNSGVQEGAVFSLIAAPLMEQENLVGLVEAVNRLDGAPFTEDDQFLLANICETASNALHNASLLQAERKVEILEALVTVSGEITSTLDLDHVLDTIVNAPSSVIPYERAAIALEQRGRLAVKAISGINKINPEDPATERLQELLEWARSTRDSIFVAQVGEKVDAERPETRAKFEKYFTDSGMRAFHAVPLADDDGLLGILSFESSDPDFLSTAHLEMIKVLAGQATVALRNASLYREVPFIDVLQPILEKKRKFLALEKKRRIAILAAAAIGIICLIVLPLPLRVDGSAVVAPLHSARVQPELAGVLNHVNVREGDAVKQGTVLATLSDWPYRAELGGAEARYKTAVSQMDEALSANDGAKAGIFRTQVDYWSSEVSRDRERLDQTALRSPINGVVATAHIEDMVGRSLNPGDTFAEVIDSSSADVDIGIEERDVALLQPGDKAVVKLDGFPTRTFHGVVSVVSPKAQLENEERVFYARVSVPNPEGVIRDGMQGRGKIATGWKPAGVVLLRRPAMWLWSKIWSWFGW
jgi:RND family efflux transporter MFP subunit